MAKMTITVPDEHVQDLLDAIWWWRPPADDSISKADHAADLIEVWLEKIYKDYKTQLARKDIKDDAEQDYDDAVAEIVIEASTIEVS